MKTRINKQHIQTQGKYKTNPNNQIAYGTATYVAGQAMHEELRNILTKK